MLELVDVEPLLDDRRIVLHYLGPHRLDAAELLATLCSTCKFDVVLEPIGRDVSDPLGMSLEEDHTCDHCRRAGGVQGSGGIGTPGSASFGGACSDCGTQCILANMRSP
jgi:hypothetical protein